MFTVNLAELGRESTLRVRRRIPAADPGWDEADVVLAEELEVDLTVSETASGQVVARGRVSGVSRHDCKRCLAPVRRAIELELTLVWLAKDELAGEEGDAETRVLEPGELELRLGEAVREEVLLAIPRFALCRDECRGLCPRCGINRNENTCPCSFDEPDPRWDALRALQQE